MNTNLYDRYVVKDFDDFKSNYKQVTEIKTFLNNDSPICIISGSLASGKSTLMYLIETYRNDVEVLKLTHNDIDYSKSFDNFVCKRSIENMIFKKKRYVLVDDIHLCDKQFINKVAKTNLRGADVKVVVTVQYKEESKITELKAQKVNATYVKLNKISFQDCFLVISELIENLKLTSACDLDEVILLIKRNNCNLRQTLQNLAKPTDLDSKTNNYSDMNVYDLARTFIKSKVDEKFVSLAMSNLVLFLLYENLPKLLPLKVKAYRNDNIDAHISILNDIILFNDENYIQDGSSNTILDYRSVIKVNDTINKVKDLQNVPLKYTNIFNKLSIQSSFNKKLAASLNTELFCKPYQKAMCHLKTKEGFVIKKIIIDFTKS